jgi:hypothetical protein
MQDPASKLRRILLFPRTWVNKGRKKGTEPTYTSPPEHQARLLEGEPLLDPFGHPRPLGDLGGLLPDLGKLEGVVLIEELAPSLGHESVAG